MVKIPIVRRRQPHEGNIVGSLFRARAFQLPPEQLQNK